jgi:hypothetical protein
MIEKMADELFTAIKAYVAGIVGTLAKRVATLEVAIKEIPTPQKGDTGKDGVDGKDGRDGIDGKDGRDGIDGINGKDGRDGINGKDGAAGKDGKGVTVDDFRQMFEAEHAKWALEFERRANDKLQNAIEAIPRPKDGVDGMSIEDMFVTHDGDGNITIGFARGELKREFVVPVPRFKDKGVFREGDAYRAGDGATWAGSFWIAQKDNPEGKPDSGNGHWRLAVKRGRDGKDSK